MKFVKLSCENCNAQLEVDLDHLQAYCQYCGQKLLIDFDNTSQVLSEKEKTKRAFNKEKEQTKRIQIEHEYQERKEKRDDSNSNKILIVLLLLIIISMGYMNFMTHKEERDHIKNNEIKITFSADEVNGENYEDVKKRFTSLGFTDIEFIKDEDLLLAVLSKDGEVEKVTIDGDSSFTEGDWFSKDSEILITYHTYKDKTE